MPDVKWPVELAAIADLHREEEAASRGVIRATPWQPGATAEALSRCEVALGCKLDPEHRSFLAHADGWSAFSGNIDLLGTIDLAGSARYAQALAWIKVMHRGVLGPHARRRGALVPVGKSSASSDLLVMARDGGQIQPRVVWFANELIEDFSSFSEMVFAFKAYIRGAIEYWKTRAEQRGR